MRLVLPLLFLLLMLISACEKHDEVLPVQPTPDTAATVAKKEVSDVTQTQDETPQSNVDSASSAIDSVSSGIDSALYRYGKFNDMPYRILFPKKYDATKSYPLLIFLHGIGERGTDNERQLTWGASLFQADSIREKYPAFIVFPQCPGSEYWFKDWGIHSLKGLIDKLVKDHEINKGKIYIGGLSMGAYGTYAMAAQYPEIFSAAVAISGDGDENKAAVMAKTKWRIFAGEKDNVVPSNKSEKMAKALKKSGASVLFTLYPQADHVGSWVNAFAEPDFCSWLFSSSRSVKH